MRPTINSRFVLRAMILVVVVCLLHPAYCCSFADGYFHQVTSLRGTLVGMSSHGWPPWLRQHLVRSSVNLALYEYEYGWSLRSLSEMSLVKAVKTDEHGWFDFGKLPDGHYTLVIGWPREFRDWFDVQITNLPEPTVSVTIDISPVEPDCTGGHEFISSSKGGGAAAAKWIDWALIAIMFETPFLLFWGWVRWRKHERSMSVVSKLSRMSFVIATVSAGLAVLILALALTGGFDPFLLIGIGVLISLAAIVLALIGSCGPGPLRWYAPSVATGTLVFWYTMVSERFFRL